MSKVTMKDRVECPYCRHKMKMKILVEDIFELVTYWGQDSEVEVYCDHCGETIKLKEKVDRHWEIVNG